MFIDDSAAGRGPGGVRTTGGTRWEKDDPSETFLRVKGARDLTRRQLAVLRELVPWRDETARSLDRATFRVWGTSRCSRSRVRRHGHETHWRREGYFALVLDQRAGDVVAAVERGLAVVEGDLPRSAGARWDRDPDFDDRVARLKAVRECEGGRARLDPGVLGARERLETIARNTTDARGVGEIPDLRRWQIEVMGDAMLRATRRQGEVAITRMRDACDGPVAPRRSSVVARLEAQPTQPPEPRYTPPSFVSFVESGATVGTWTGHPGANLPGRAAAGAAQHLDPGAGAAAERRNLPVRRLGDAFYDSRLEPWSEYLTGAQGRAPTRSGIRCVCRHRSSPPGARAARVVQPYRRAIPAAVRPPRKQPDAASTRLVRSYGLQVVRPGRHRSPKIFPPRRTRCRETLRHRGVHLDD